MKISIVAAFVLVCACASNAGAETAIEVPGRYAEKPDGYAEIELRDWKFAKDDDALGKDPNAIGKLAWKTVKVPHDWAIEGPFNPLGDGGTGKLPWKGAGWYSTVLPASFSGYIVFEGVMARSRAFLDGVEVGGSDYGYMGYFFRVEKSAHERTLLVRVDTFAHKSRWYPGAGIYRPVRAIRFEGETVVPDSVRIVTKELTPERAVAEVAFDTNLSRGHSFRISVEKPRLWDVDDPHLYSVTVLGRKLKFGFRNAQFTVDKGFWLNGRRVEIRGACLHSDLGILGMEFNVSAARRQLRILKEAGFNAVRTAHNCPAPGLLDLCDEMGMLVWNECFDKWDALSGRMPSQNLEEYVSKYLRRFVRRDRLHPCVVIWSMGNEIGHNTGEKQDGTTRERCRLFRQVIREEDATRPVGIASCEFYETMIKEGDYDDLDVVGYNYMGRYAFYRQGRKNIPVVESESASCVALQGFYLDEWPTNKFHWSIATREVDASGRCGPGWGDPPDMDFVRMERDAYCAGQFVWTGMDYLGENWPVCVEEKTFASADGSPLALEKTARSSYFGICDLLGLPKEQYWNYRAQWKKDVDTLVISPTHWTFPGREGKRRPVQVYSNADTVELFINGRSVGRRTKNPNVRQYMTKGDKRPEWAKFWGDECQDPEGYYEVLGRYRLMWPDVVYEPGEIVAVAYGKDGKEVAVQRLCTAGEAVRLHLEPESDTLPADGDELVFVKVTAQDAKGTLVPGAMNLVEFSVAGPGEIVSVGNADPVGHRSFKDVSAHNLHYGVAGLFIRRTGPGEVALGASADGLKPASVKMRGTLAAAMATASHGETRNAVRRTLDEYVLSNRIAGVVSILSDADCNLTVDCSGWANVEKRVPISTNTVFAIFSMTKTITGAAVMCAIDEGKVSLDDKVSKYLPEYADIRMEDGSKPKRELTLRDLLSHTDGMRWEHPLVNNSIPLREAARLYASHPMKFQPGETFAYGTMRFSAAAACIEVAVGERFEDYLKRKVLDPLGMRDTTFTPNADQITRLVTAYTSDGLPLRKASDACSRQLEFPKEKPICPAPGGGLFSTPADVIRFSQMLAHHGERMGVRVISRKTFDEIFSVVQVPGDLGKANPYTVGSWIYGDWFGHEGAMRTDQRANLKTGQSRLFFIQTENKAGSDFFALKHAWHEACDKMQGTPPTKFGN